MIVTRLSKKLTGLASGDLRNVVKTAIGVPESST